MGLRFCSFFLLTTTYLFLVITLTRALPLPKDTLVKEEGIKTGHPNVRVFYAYPTAPTPTNTDSQDEESVAETVEEAEEDHPIAEDEGDDSQIENAPNEGAKQEDNSEGFVDASLEKSLQKDPALVEANTDFRTEAQGIPTQENRESTIIIDGAIQTYPESSVPDVEINLQGTAETHLQSSDFNEEFIGKQNLENEPEETLLGTDSILDESQDIANMDDQSSSLVQDVVLPPVAAGSVIEEGPIEFPAELEAEFQQTDEVNPEEIEPIFEISHDNREENFEQASPIMLSEGISPNEPFEVDLVPFTAADVQIEPFSAGDISSQNPELEDLNIRIEQPDDSQLAFDQRLNLEGEAVQDVENKEVIPQDIEFESELTPEEYESELPQNSEFQHNFDSIAGVPQNKEFETDLEQVPKFEVGISQDSEYESEIQSNFEEEIPALNKDYELEFVQNLEGGSETPQNIIIPLDENEKTSQTNSEISSNQPASESLDQITLLEDPQQGHTEADFTELHPNEPLFEKTDEESNDNYKSSDNVGSIEGTKIPMIDLDSIPGEETPDLQQGELFLASDDQVLPIQTELNEEQLEENDQETLANILEAFMTTEEPVQDDAELTADLKQ